MTLIDKYIQTHINQPAFILAEQIGVSASFVQARRTILIDQYEPTKYPVNVREEIAALLNLISVRETGWAVDIAKERIRKLESMP